MHSSDSDSPDSGRPSRSARRRDALDVLDLAEALAAMSAPQLERLGIDGDLRAEIGEAHRITSHIARKRQVHRVAKVMRGLDGTELDRLRDALRHDRDAAARDTAHLHRIEAWRDRLLADGDAALTAFVAGHPGVDVTRVRHLVRQARGEAAASKPPRAARELFRLLRDLATNAGLHSAGD